MFCSYILNYLPLQSNACFSTLSYRSVINIELEYRTVLFKKPYPWVILVWYSGPNKPIVYRWAISGFFYVEKSRDNRGWYTNYLRGCLKHPSTINFRMRIMLSTGQLCEDFIWKEPASQGKPTSIDSSRIMTALWVSLNEPNATG